MLSDEDAKWLQENYPALKIEDEKISGTIEFTATYNPEKNRFLVIKDDVRDGVGGLRLSGSFPVTITKRAETPYSKLPAVHIDGIDSVPSRHFNQYDKSACLGSPFEEQVFLEPTFNFQKFLEELVVPFLYGQVYFTEHGSWPWFDYEHGGVGLLQSVCKVQREFDQSLSNELLAYLKQDVRWPLFKDILMLPRPSKRACPCGSGNKLRDCHTDVVDGLNQLKISVKEHNLEIM